MSEEKKKPLRILLVDDHGMMRAAIKGNLEEFDKISGYDLYIESKANPQNALDEIRKADPPFDIVITDMNMKHDIDGMELIESAREMHPRLPIILATADPYKALKMTAGTYGVPVINKSHISGDYLWKEVLETIKKQQEKPVEVLLVEGNNNIANGLKELIEDATAEELEIPVNVTIVPDLDQLGNKLKKNPYDIVLADIGVDTEQGTQVFDTVEEGLPITIPDETDITTITGAVAALPGKKPAVILMSDSSFNALSAMTQQYSGVRAVLDKGAISSNINPLLQVIRNTIQPSRKQGQQRQ